jgi:hypothetical protein
LSNKWFIIFRVFDQQDFNLDEFKVSCIQFGYFMEGITNVTVGVYRDTTGGVPDYDSLVLVHMYETVTVNAVGQMQVQTVSDGEYAVNFGSDSETLVVILTTPLMSEGFILGGGQTNGDVIGTNGETYIGGDCRTDFIDFYNYAVDHNLDSTAQNQWYVRIHGSAKTSSDSNGSNGLSAGAIAGITIGVCVGVLALVGCGYFVFMRSKKSQMEQPLNRY